MTRGDVPAGRATRAAALTTVLALGLVLVGGCLHQSPARPQIVVLDIRGAGGGVVQRHVEDLAQRRFDLVPARSYWVMAERLHARALTRRNVAKVAERLRAVAVVESHVRGHRRRRVITLLVRDGKTGKVIEKHRLVVRHGHVVARGDAALERRFLDHVHTPAPPPAAPATATARTTPAPAPARTAPAPARTAPAPAPAGKQASRTAEAPPHPAGADHPGTGAASKTRGKSKSAAATRAPAAPPLPPVHYDDDGQAVNDEVPPPPAR